MTRARVFFEALRMSMVPASVLFGLALSQSAWGDAPLAVSGTLVGVIVAFGLAILRAPLFMLLAYSASLGVATVASVAIGSSWAALTWLPTVFAVVALARVSHVFMLGATATVLVSDASTLVILNQVLGSDGTSGSVQYFLGLTGVIAAPFWFEIAADARSGRWWRTVRVVAVLMSALALWSVSASGSRSALLGLAVVVVASLVRPLFSMRLRPTRWRPTLAALAAVVVLVPAIDYGLGLTFGTGGSTAVPTLIGSVEDSIVAADHEDRQPGGVRLSLWRQAATALAARPLGHGPGSYAHVNHAYQNDPLLWSGSPHSVWALAAVETGLPGLIALLSLVIGGLWVAARRGSPAMPALLGATAVMSLDVFGSMPVQSLLWWAIIGAAWGPSGNAKGWMGRLSTVALAMILTFGLYTSWRLVTPCVEGCDPIAWYGGHPQLVGTPSRVIGENPDDPRWAAWSQLYPLAFWLNYSEVIARASQEPTALIDLLRAYPYQSAETYVSVSDAFAGQPMAADVAACGLVRFFDGRRIYRDWRAQGTQLADERRALEERAGHTQADEQACIRSGIPRLAIGSR